MKKIPYEIKKCILCGSSIAKRKHVSHLAYSKYKFCKNACQHKWNTLHKRTDLKCDMCEKEMRKKNSGIGKRNFCSLDCARKYKTKRCSKSVKCFWCGIEFRKTLGQIKATKKNFCSRRCMGEWQSKFKIGVFSGNWKGGKTSTILRIRSLVRYADWALSVFKRDSFTCQRCGDKRGGNLNAHHKKYLSVIVEENNLKEMYDILRCKDIWDIGNGVTLCEDCHKNTHGYSKNGSMKNENNT